MWLPFNEKESKKLGDFRVKNDVRQMEQHIL